MKIKETIFFLSLVCLTNSVWNQTQFSTFLINNNTHGAVSIYSIDIEHDGDIDILSAAAEDNAIIWWRNDGGTPIEWTKKIVGNNFMGAKSVYAGDIDNDNDIDVVGCASDAAQIAIWYNSGEDPISWTKSVVRYNYSWAHEVFLSDMDNDSDLDILGASSTLNQITLFKNMGGNPIIWQEVIIGENFTQAKSVSAGDIDNDGDNDILGASLLDNQIAWWKNDGTDTWSKNIVSSSFGGAHHIQLEDIDNDGWLDVLCAGWYANQIAWWKNSGSNPITWTKQIIGSSFNRTCVAYAIDIDNDGIKDVVGSAQDGDQVAWWKNDGSDPINWTKFVIDGNFNRVWPVHAADLDNDGDVDVIAGSGQEGTNEIKWYENVIDPAEIKIDNNIKIPGRFYLYQNYPNPFNPWTIIKYELPNDANVTIRVFDVLGKEILKLVDAYQHAGLREFNFDASELAGGVYFYRLECNQFCQTKKMMIIK